jgi:hypothetical protein
MPTIKTYHVWDSTDGPDGGALVEATTIEAATENYAEADMDRIDAGVYSSASGHPLRVRDPDGDVWEVCVSLDWLPHFNGKRVRV